MGVQRVGSYWGVGGDGSPGVGGYGGARVVGAWGWVDIGVMRVQGVGG